jgi:probable rRNA maturation factor
MNLVIANRQRTKRINLRLFKKIIRELFVELNLKEGELGIHLVGAKEMAAVNWQYLQHEGSTDVITFDHAEGRAGSPLPAVGAHGVTRPTIYGELFICVDDAIAQAKEFQTTWQSELVRYAVHGVLHLQGYDDLKPHLRRVMKREENRLVKHLVAKFSFAQLARTAKLKA